MSIKHARNVKQLPVATHNMFHILERTNELARCNDLYQLCDQMLSLILEFSKASAGNIEIIDVSSGKPTLNISKGDGHGRNRRLRQEVASTGSRLKKFSPQRRRVRGENRRVISKVQQEVA